MRDGGVGKRLWRCWPLLGVGRDTSEAQVTAQPELSRREYDEKGRCS